MNSRGPFIVGVLFLIYTIGFLYAIEGLKVKIKEAYDQGYEKGKSESITPKPKCSTQEHLKWWTTANNLNEVKRALCSNHKGN